MKPKLLIALIFVLGVGLWAQTGERIAFVNVQQALQQTQEGKKALADLTMQFKPKQTQLTSEQTQIQTLQQQLQNGGDTLSADAKAELARTIQTKEQEYQRDAQDAQSDFQTAQSDAANRLFRKLVTVIQDYAQAHGYDLILDASPPQAPVLYAAKKIDVTDEVVKQYDQQHPVAASAAPAAKSSATHTPPAN